MEKIVFDAFIFGLLSASALPLGAVVASIWSPKQKFTAFMMAFGSGALFAVISIDLVSGVVTKGDFYPLAIGAVIGGVLFFVLNQLINSRGGFLRKLATTINYLKVKKVQHYKNIFEKMSKAELFSHLPAEEIQSLLPYISSRTYKKGALLIKQGEKGESLFIIEDGEIDIIDEKNAFPKKIATLKEGDVLGEIALITGGPRSVTAIAVKDTKVWKILKEDFDRLLQVYPNMASAVKNLVSVRIGELQQKEVIDKEKAKEWVDRAIKNIDSKLIIPLDTEIKEIRKSEPANPLSIWLGCLIDGIPESLVVGSSLLHKHFSLSLIAGLFISNFPESLSGSVGLREQNYSFRKIFWLWILVMVLSGLSSALGNIFLTGTTSFVFTLVEGMAAGAMLTMIAETMLPEAYYKGGTITGLSTLLGFLLTIFFKVFER